MKHFEKGTSLYEHPFNTHTFTVLVSMWRRFNWIFILFTSPAAACDPKCKGGQGICQSNGRCFCWWGWTGPHATYIMSGPNKNRILVRQVAEDVYGWGCVRQAWFSCLLKIFISFNKWLTPYICCIAWPCNPTLKPNSRFYSSHHKTKSRDLSSLCM